MHCRLLLTVCAALLLPQIAHADADTIIEQSGVQSGFFVHLGAGDGQLTEAMTVGDKQRHVALQRLVREHRRELDDRWQRNIILNKWLDYLSDQGHLILDR